MPGHALERAWRFAGDARLCSKALCRKGRRGALWRAEAASDRTEPGDRSPTGDRKECRGRSEPKQPQADQCTASSEDRDERERRRDDERDDLTRGEPEETALSPGTEAVGGELAHCASPPPEPGRVGGVTPPAAPEPLPSPPVPPALFEPTR